MAEPVKTSRSSHIGGHEIIEEIGSVNAYHRNAYERCETKSELPPNHYYEKISDGLFSAHYYPYWQSEADAIDALKEKAREKGANGIINLETHHKGKKQKWDRASGIAVKVESK